MDSFVNVNLKVSDYANRVLGVIKAKYGLKDKGEALNKFAIICGGEFVEPEVSDEYVKKMVSISEDHLKKYGKRRMTEKEMDFLFGK